MAGPALLEANGRAALVIGASGGIGAAVASMLQDCGALVAGTARDAQRLPAASESYLPLSVDATDEAAVAGAVSETVARFGQLDFAVNMAGIVGAGRLASMSLDDWNRVVDANLTSCFLLAKHSYPHLKASRGVVVLCSSTNGINGGSHLSGAAYACSKAAILNLNRYLAKEWAPDGIRVNCVVPGPVDTPMLDRLTEEQHQGIKKVLPLGRYATADEVAKATVFLCSSAAASMTGATINISSGLVFD